MPLRAWKVNSVSDLALNLDNFSKKLRPLPLCPYLLQQLGNWQRPSPIAHAQTIFGRPP